MNLHELFLLAESGIVFFWFSPQWPSCNTLKIQEWGETLAAKISHLFRGENYIVMYFVFYRNRVGEWQLSCKCDIQSHDMILVNHIILSKDFKHFVLAQSWWMRCSLQLTRFRTYCISCHDFHPPSSSSALISIHLSSICGSYGSRIGPCPGKHREFAIFSVSIGHECPRKFQTWGRRPGDSRWGGSGVESGWKEARFWVKLRCNRW